MRGLIWKVWASVGVAGLAAALSSARAPEARPAPPVAQIAASEQGAPIGGAPAPARLRDAAAAATGANASASGGYALTEGPRYRPTIAEDAMGYEGYQIFDQVAVGDVNGDGRDDLVATTQDNSVHVFLQQPQGGLALPPQVWRFPHDGRFRQMTLQLLDLNGDGALDIVVPRARYTNDAPAAGFNVLLSDGRGGLSLRQWFGETLVGRTMGMDIDQDGHDDIVGIVARTAAPGECVRESGGTSCERLRVLYSDGQGGIRGTAELPLGRSDVRVAGVLDFDGDGRRDIVYSDADKPFGPRRLMWRRQLPQGGLGEATVIGAWPGWLPLEASVGDFNGDGRLDIVTGGYYEGSANVYTQLPGGGFSAAQPFPANPMKSQLLVADFDGDGRADLVSVQQAPGLPEDQVVLAYHLQRDGALAAPQWNGTSHGPTQIGGHQGELAYGDFNGDGCRDVAVAANYEGVMFYYGSGCQQAAISSQDCRTEQNQPLTAASAAMISPPTAQSPLPVNKPVQVPRQVRILDPARSERPGQTQRQTQWQRRQMLQRRQALAQQRQFQGQNRRGGLSRRFTAAPARTPMRLLRYWRKR